MTPTTMLRLPAAMAVTGLGRSAIYDAAKRGTVTRAVRIGARAMAWPADELMAINEARVAGLCDDAIKALVQRLHAAREQRASATLAANG